jgi:hypothetical protein
MVVKESHSNVGRATRRLSGTNIRRLVDAGLTEDYAAAARRDGVRRASARSRSPGARRVLLGEIAA